MLQYYDTDLLWKERELVLDLERLANDALDTESLLRSGLRDEAQARLDSIEDEVQELNNMMYVDPVALGLDQQPPELELTWGDVRQADTPLIDTEGNWVEQTQNLINRKQYKQGSAI